MCADGRRSTTSVRWATALGKIGNSPVFFWFVVHIPAVKGDQSKIDIGQVDKCFKVKGRTLVLSKICDRCVTQKSQDLAHVWRTTTDRYKRWILRK